VSSKGVVCYRPFNPIIVFVLFWGFLSPVILLNILMHNSPACLRKKRSNAKYMTQICLLCYFILFMRTRINNASSYEVVPFFGMAFPCKKC
jgi:hypothetical protein